MSTYPPETTNDVVTSWIPLTTGWVYEPHCSSVYVRYKTKREPFSSAGSITTTERTKSRSSFVAFDPLLGLSVVDIPITCLPREVTISQTQPQQNLGIDQSLYTTTSLLPLKCPAAWTTVGTFVKSSISTQVMCCPSDYYLSQTAAFSTGVEGVCASMVTQYDTLEYVDGENLRVSLSEPNNPLSEYDSFPQLSTTTLVSDITAQAVAIIGWNVQSTASPTPNPSTNQTNSKFLTYFATQTPSSPPANGSQLRSGAKAGIGVSVGVGIIFIIALIAWTIVLKRRNRNLSAKTQTNKDLQTQSKDVFNPPPLCERCGSQSNELDHENLREIGGSQMNELSHRSLGELGNPVSVPVELSVATPRTLTAPLNPTQTR